MLRLSELTKRIAASLCAAVFCMPLSGDSVLAADISDQHQIVGEEQSVDEEDAVLIGGGYAASRQSGAVGYTSKIYDETSGLVTSDANYILGSTDGYIWIGSYSGIFRYDGNVFEKIDYSEGLTSGRGLFEDSKGRIWVGTNDNGVVVIEGLKATWITYKDGLPSSSIRVFSEDNIGNVYIGTTAGVCYADPDLRIHVIDDERLNEERVLRLDHDQEGTIYGATKNGIAFSIKDMKVDRLFTSGAFSDDTITSILADPQKDGNVYITTDGGMVYRGQFGATCENMKGINVNPIVITHWINYDCGRIWISSRSEIGYIDENDEFNLVENLPMDSGIEMITSDYQGNLWVASSAQGIMKIVSTNFVDLFEKFKLPHVAVNTTCISGSLLYVGTDEGVYILGDEVRVENRITEYLKNARIRDIMKDKEGNMWISTFTGGFGLVCYSKKGTITNYNTAAGMPSNEIRCVEEASDGSILVCTNGGLVFIKNGQITRVVGADDGIKNTVFLTATEGPNGDIYVGTDGDGLYIVTKSGVKRLGRENGLTSDVILRIKKDVKEDIYWLLESNSIGYMKNGVIKTVTSFPYNNNFDLVFGEDDTIWVISSNGVYTTARTKMINDDVTDYRLFTLSNGLSSAPTSNSFNALDEEGNLYISGRHGVCKVNINSFFSQKMNVKAALKSIYFADQRILPDSDGIYVLPGTDSRVVISAAVLDYTLVDPFVNVFMEGDEEDAIITPKSKLASLEYTGMNQGEYTLHVRVLAGKNEKAMLDQTYMIVKQPKLSELWIIRVLFLIITAAITGLIVWRVMKGTVIRRQLEEIRQAKDDAERANSAKTRFLANISHEIRTPINTIQGMDEMIMREDPSNVPKGYFLAMMNYAFDIKNATDSLLSLINDLLDISKIESGKMHLVEQEYDVQELLRSIVSMIRVKSTEKELTFDVVVDEVLPVRLYGDAGKIKQIVLNLLTNAVKYTDKGGFILMVSLVERENDRLNISFKVKDTGMGVKPEDIEKLFTAYERLDEQKNSAIQGTGLGLDISRRFAELMGGSLTCESVYGEGSEFVLNINQKIVDDTPIGVFIEHDEKSVKGPYVPKFIAPDADVLVVDDNPMNLSVIKGLLKATKIFVTTANSGEECLEKMKTTRFNVVLLDHMMPGMDGIETVAKIRETDKDIPVYALTANTSAGEEFYKSKGFTGYLSKPIDTEVLEKTIMKHLPEEIMLKPEETDAAVELTSMPEDMNWIYDTPGITVEEGIKNSGGIEAYIFSLKLFLDTIDSNRKVIRDAYEANDIRLYTIKVHALKSSARIIGAKDLSQLCAQLEEAGNKQDTDFIHLHNDEMLSDYLAYKDKLARLSADAADDGNDNREQIPEAELQDAYSALKDVVPQMDYDAVEFIISDLNKFKLPEKDAEKIKELSAKLKVFDWESMEKLLNE